MATNYGKIYLGNVLIASGEGGDEQSVYQHINETAYGTQAPSGFSVTISNQGIGSIGDCFYSLDGGTTWIDISDVVGSVELTGVTQIMFKADDPEIASWGRIISSQLGLNLSGEDGPNLSQNYILTQNITDVTAYTFYD